MCWDFPAHIKKPPQTVDAPRKPLLGKGFSPTVLPTGFLPFRGSLWILNKINALKGWCHPRFPRFTHRKPWISFSDLLRLCA